MVAVERCSWPACATTYQGAHARARVPCTLVARGYESEYLHELDGTFIVTLNIAVAHPECVYVAADFRLSRMTGRQTVPMDEPSMKVVRFSYPASLGLITYTGFGAGRDGADTAIHIIRWLDGKRDLEIPDVVEVLREKGDAWLRRLRPFPFKHTFMVAGFGSQGEAILSIVSNFESLTRSTLAQPATSLSVSVESTRRRAIIRVTGVPEVVPKERERLLRRTVENNALDSARIKHAMMGIIERAAGSPASHGLVSDKSSAISLLPGGSGRQNFSEPTGVELHGIFNGAVMPSVLSLLGGNHQKIAESVFIGGKSAPYHQDRCHPNQYEGSAAGAYQLTELSVPGSPPFSARAINHNGVILASSAVDNNAAYRQHWLYKSHDDIERIPLQEPTAGDAIGFDNRGYVYLAVGMPGQVQVLARWNATELRLLPHVADYPSSASWISPSGWIAGFVEVSGDQTRVDRQQPARWDPEGRLEMPVGIPNGVAGTATSIAADGTALVQLYRSLGPLSSHVWYADGNMHPLQLPFGGLATGITDAHSFMGFRVDLGRRIAVTSSDMSNWVDLGTPIGWDPTRVAPDGSVAGHVRIDGFLRPWIRFTDGIHLTLPGFHRHQCSIEGIGADGNLVGSAFADHCSHALLWKKSFSAIPSPSTRPPWERAAPAPATSRRP